MTIERKTTSDEIQKTCERLKPGHKLSLAGPNFLTAFAFIDKENNALNYAGRVNEKTMISLFNEYDSIYKLLKRLVGKNLIVIKTDFTVGKSTPTGPEFKNIDLPNEMSYGSVSAPFLTTFYRSWPRDAHTLINGKILANKDAWNIEKDNIRISGLGEGGKVFTKKNSILVTPDIWKNSRDEIRGLINIGFKVGYLPFVDPKKQRHDFKENHLDGHSGLIEDKNGQLALVVAHSYSHQGNGTRKLIIRACESIDAQIVEVDDRNLPPLPFNFEQFEDRSIAVTNSEARDLEVTLMNLAGEDKVFKTDVPLVKIPRLTCGGIRCLTNIIPSSVVKGQL
ncbi:MAG: hypothetical protein Q8P29_03900 [Candidatus Levybacteria bacterium]|nr:hypothetical protein [Candidatus Levybacteria bacterium]